MLQTWLGKYCLQIPSRRGFYPLSAHDDENECTKAVLPSDANEETLDRRSNECISATCSSNHVYVLLEFAFVIGYISSQVIRQVHDQGISTRVSLRDIHPSI